MRPRGALASPLLAGLVFVACSRASPSTDPGREVVAPVTADPSPGLHQTPFLFAAAVEEAVDASVAAPPSLAGKVILHVGDSMVGGDGGLTKALEARFEKEGAKFVRDYKVSESIVSFDHSPRLKELLAKHRPDIVILTLGTNDVFVPYPQAMTRNIQSIVKRMGARECYWIGPPTWKPDTGIVAAIRDSAGPCKFFDSSNMKLHRAGDGIHPTNRGGAEWAERFWSFFRPEAAAPDAGALL